MTAPAIPDSLRARLLKTLELARRGIGGEKDNAQVMLEKLLRAHGLSLADLEELESPPTEWLWIEGADASAGVVAVGIFLLVCGAKCRVCNGEYERADGHHGVDQRWVGAEVSAAQRAAITVLWEVYSKAWDDATRDLAWAFIRKHQLLPADGHALPRPEPVAAFSKEWLEQLAAERRRNGFAQLLERVERPVQRLGGGRP